MKKIFFVLFALFLAASTQSLKAQVKIKLGHIDSNELMQMMPGRDSAEKALEAYAKSLEDQLTIMSQEFETKYAEYLENQDKYLEPIRQSKEKELVDLKARIDEFRNTAQEMLSKEEARLVQPLIDKAKKAIDEVAVEKGYTYIFDTGVGALLYYQDSDDIMPFVKVKLGIQ